MSRLSDYSKFDHLDSSDDDEEQEHAGKAKAVQQRQPQQMLSAPAVDQDEPLQFRRSTAANSNRFVLEYGNRLIYEWEQSLNDVTLYIPTPPFVRTAADVVCHIQTRHLQVGNLVDGVAHLFLDEATAGNVEVASSTWTWEKATSQNNKTNNTGLLTIELQKAHKGVVWEAACLGPPPRNVRLNPMQLEEERQRLLLERWQEENPGMDFRGATFNGGAPDPRSFMGGVSYK